jgi:hypothetical protein
MPAPSRRRSILRLCCWSLALAAVLVAWVRSHWLVDVLRVDALDAVTVVQTKPGGVAVELRQMKPGRPPRWPLRYGNAPVPPGWSWPGRFGFHAARQGLGGTVVDPIYEIAAPLWLPAGVLSLLTWRAWRQVRKRSRPGRCAQCGYDLRATPDRCPECGRVADEPVGG